MSERPPVVFLLAVWESYIEHFCNFGLRSLIAPGNIPALSQEFACTFVFLTKEKDIPLFLEQPFVQHLSTYCTIDYLDISDLIFENNYSATLTLAYERGMRSRKEEMCNTHFFFFVSDYILADGSLRNIAHYLKEGYSGITAGNFLVVEEYMADLFKERILADEQGILSLNPREILALSFPYMHPVSVGHTVTQPYTYCAHANRLFWKVNDHVMVGRFFLRHMLCIRPEREDYVIGASCDYSFIPEMCPSGKVAHIQDSDEYCVIEMAPYDYEQSWIRAGKYGVKNLAQKLSDWTTAIHRANAHIPVIYHSVELSEPPLAILQKSAEFIHALEKQLSPNPHPLRGHFHWICCIETILYKILLEKKVEQHLRNGALFGVIGSPTFSFLWDGRALLKITDPPVTLPLPPAQQRRAHLKKMLSGNFPHTSPWHLDWFDDRIVRLDVAQMFKAHQKGLVIAFLPIPEIVDWLEQQFPGQCTYQLYDALIRLSPADQQPLFQGIDHVLIWLTDDHFCEMGATIRLCARYVPTGTPISVYLKHNKGGARAFKRRLSICAANLLSVHVECEQTRSHYSFSRAAWDEAHKRYINRALTPHLWTRASGFASLGALAVASTLGNLFSYILSCMRFVPKKHNTSATIRFKSRA